MCHCKNKKQYTYGTMPLFRNSQVAAADTPVGVVQKLRTKQFFPSFLANFSEQEAHGDSYY